MSTCLRGSRATSAKRAPMMAGANSELSLPPALSTTGCRRSRTLPITSASPMISETLLAPLMSFSITA